LHYKLQSNELEVIYPKILAVRSELERVYQRPLLEHLHLHFLPPEEFATKTGLHNGSKALYNDGHIFLSTPASYPSNHRQLEGSLRHELSHSFVAKLSDHKCPAWMDEGLAQYFEGVSIRKTTKKLRGWLNEKNQLIPFSMLNSNLTLLPPSFVAVAYEQSLYATQSLINKKGFSAIRNYLRHLTDHVPHEQAFTLAFGFDTQQFESQLAKQLTQEIDLR